MLAPLLHTSQLGARFGGWAKLTFRFRIYCSDASSVFHPNLASDVVGGRLCRCRGSPESFGAVRAPCVMHRDVSIACRQQGKQVMYAEAKSKAHNCKVLIRWLATICHAKRNEWDGYGAKLASATFYIADFCYSMDQIKTWRLSEAEAQHLHLRAHQFFRAYKVLALEALAARLKRYGSMVSGASNPTV